MKTRNLFMALTLIASFMFATITLVIAHPCDSTDTSTNVTSVDRKRRGIPAPTPSPITKRPKPIQSPRPKG